MKNKPTSVILRFILPLAFWLLVWQAGAQLVEEFVVKPGSDGSYFLPTPIETLKELFVIVRAKGFLKTVLITLYRILSGLLIGSSLGFALGILSYKSRLVYSLFAPAISVVKATPVASIIILLWIMPMSGNGLCILIALLMVLPIIWQNVYDGLSATDPALAELSLSYEFSFFKKVKLLYLPTLSDFLIPALITATGLAFKSEIAAEIIAGVRISIGEMIYTSKDSLNTPAVFAWTIVGIFFSILFEKLTKFLLSFIKYYLIPY